MDVKPLVKAMGLACIAGACLWSSARASDLASEARIYLDAQITKLAGDVEIEVGEPESTRQLADCTRVDPFIPPNARLWGRTHIGLRCTQGATWTTYLPIRVRVFAPAPVATRAIARGEPVGPNDYALERIELTQWPLGEIATVADLEGRIATRAIAGAEPIRRGHLKLLPLISPGDEVKVMIETPTFVISTEGKALTSGGAGQGVQVSLASGKTVWGTANPGKVVLIK
jgi:flagella basal body P-ring formation protein FlgA